MYDLNTVNKAYSYWGKSRFLYNLSSKISFFGYESFLRKRLVALMELKKGSRVLDLACGTGINFRFIENKIGDKGEIIAIDYIKEMIKCSEKESRKYKNIKLIKDDAANMKFPDNYFDGIISTLGLSAIPEHFKVLKICKRILKPNCKIAILDGKYSGINYLKHFINPGLKIIRWEKTWQPKKNIIKDTSGLFKITKLEKYFLDTTFVLVGEKT